jgi:hypothetical protein
MRFLGHASHINMDNLFKALPRDLQWELLTEFVGTHVVRGGKLMRKIVLTKTDGKTFRQTGGKEIPVADIFLRNRKNFPLISDRPKFLRVYSDANKVMQFFRDQRTDDTVYLHRTFINHMVLYEVRYLVTQEEDSVVLPSFHRTTYPSYPYTSKKRKIAL